MFGRSETKELRNWNPGRLDVAPWANPRLNSIESFIRYHYGRGKPHVVYVNQLTHCFGLLSSGSKFKALTCMGIMQNCRDRGKSYIRVLVVTWYCRMSDKETSNTTVRK